MQLNLYVPHTTHKDNSKCTTDLNIRPKTIKFLGENIGIQLHDLELSKDYSYTQRFKQRLLTDTKIMIYKRKNDKEEFIKMFKLYPLEKKAL